MTPDGATILTPGQLTTDELRALAPGGQEVRLDDGCWPAVEAAARVVEAAARGEAAVYGVNTGFGKLATNRIAPADILELQRRLVLSHMCGVGAPLPDPVVRLILALKATSLAHGLFRGPAADHRAAGRAPQSRRVAGDPGQGLGRRVRRSGAARPSRRLPDRPGRDPLFRGLQAGRRGSAGDRGERRSSSGPRRAWRCSTAPRSRPRWRWSAGSGRRRCSRRRWSRAP